MKIYLDLQVFTKTKRSYNLKDTLEQIISAMKACEGELHEGWRNPDGFWGNVTMRCGHSNTDYLRRAMYMVWHKNTGNITEKFNNPVTSTLEESLSEIVCTKYKAFFVLL
jgi:hypothetical protein